MGNGDKHILASTTLYPMISQGKKNTIPDPSRTELEF